MKIDKPEIEDLTSSQHDHLSAEKGGVLSGYAPLVSGKVPTVNLGGTGADSTKFLRGDQTWQVISGGGNHNLLSTTHPDTVVGSPVAGDIIIANTTPAWTKLAKGTQNQVLTMGASLPQWTTTLATTAIPNLDASKITTGRFGMARMPDGTSGHFLRANGPGADPSYAAVTATPGGSNTHVQINDEGVLYGNLNFTFNKATNVVYANTLLTGTLQILESDLVPVYKTTITGYPGQMGNINLVLPMNQPTKPSILGYQYNAGTGFGFMTWHPNPSSKGRVKAASTANISSFYGTITLDGVFCGNGDRVLVKNQTSPATNGVWVVVEGGPWYRDVDMDHWDEIVSALVVVEQGNTQADTTWLCTSNSGGTLGTTAITWTQIGTGGVPGGSNTQVQFNDGGVFGGDSELTWNKTADILYAKNLQVKGPWVDVKAFGAVGNGSTDDTAAIQNALNSISSSGGCVFIPQGVYLISTTLQIANNVHLYGTGWSSVLRATSSLSGAILRNRDTHPNLNEYITISDLYFDGNKSQRSSGHCLYFNNLQWSRLRNLRLENAPEYGIVFDGSQAFCDEISILDCLFRYCNNSGIYFNTASCNMVTNCSFFSNNMTTGYGAINIIGGSTNVINGCSIMSNRRHGIYLSYAYGNTIKGCVIVDNYRHGIYLHTSANDNIVAGNTCDGNSKETSNTYSGIVLEPALRTAVTGNRCYNGAFSTPTQRHGVIETGSADYNCIVGNVLRGNLSSSLVKVGTNTIAADNIV